MQDLADQARRTLEIASALLDQVAATRALISRSRALLRGAQPGESGGTARAPQPEPGAGSRHILDLLETAQSAAPRDDAILDYLLRMAIHRVKAGGRPQAAAGNVTVH